MWRQASKKYTNKLKRALRLIYFAQKQTHAIPFFIETNMSPINILYFEEIAILMHNVVNNKVPKNLSKLFTNISEIHSYNTRASKSKKLYVERSRLNQQKRSFFRVAARLWNEIPKDVRNLPKKAFRREIRKRLFSILEFEGTYVDVADLIKKF